MHDRSWLRAIKTAPGNVIELPEWYLEVKDSIEALGDRQDGWKGPDSFAPNEHAKRNAHQMLRNLATAGISRQPRIGLDFEGTFSFSWFDDYVSGDLTVYDDGTYSFFISNKHDSAGSDEEPLDSPLDSGLLGILRS